MDISGTDMVGSRDAANPWSWSWSYLALEMSPPSTAGRQEDTD